ncbi:hypothetical protein CUMW_113710, partial [Citrus unshiu]
ENRPEEEERDDVSERIGLGRTTDILDHLVAFLVRLISLTYQNLPIHPATGANTRVKTGYVCVARKCFAAVL